MRIAFVDHQTLAKLADKNLLSLSDNPELDQLRESVNEAIKALPEDQQTIIRMYYFERASLKQIIAETGYTERKAIRAFAIAKTALKHSLAEIVKKRWPACKVKSSKCPICDHPRRTEIDSIILQKPKSQNWRQFNQMLFMEFGFTVNPPSLIKYHIQYHQRSKENG
jgi:hypothetical protein